VRHKGGPVHIAVQVVGSGLQHPPIETWHTGLPPASVESLVQATNPSGICAYAFQSPLSRASVMTLRERLSIGSVGSAPGVIGRMARWLVLGAKPRQLFTTEPRKKTKAARK
jgi:hypothetical protein